MVSVMEMEKANIVEPGNIPTEPSSPNVKYNTLIGGLFGGFISALIILVIYIMDDSIKNVEDIERRLGIIPLGTIPIDRKKRNILRGKRNVIGFRKRDHKGEGTEDDSCNLEKDQLDFSSNEAYKSLRTNIQFCGKDVKTICVTSSIPNEGKTVVSFRLASTIAERGKKVLFIDADLRKSVIVGRLKIDKEMHGLSQYLSGMNDLDDVINKTGIANVDIIFTGPLPPNPSELLGSDMFIELIRRQREKYDYIIVDTPPLGVVIDGANVAAVCDGTIIVVESNNISYKLAQGVLKQLEKGNCRVLGAVLNKVDMKRKGYYGKDYGKEYEK
jgi:capsular exopolysaccharide synthesis family protein